MSKSNMISSESPSNWLFSSEKISSTDITLEQRQKFAKFIFDLGIKIPVKTNLCLYTAIAYMQRFFMVQSSEQFSPIRLCQTALFFACKKENNPVTIQQICEKTAELLNLTWNRASNTGNILQNEILDYEDALFSTLALGIIVQHPFDNIKNALDKVQITNREKHSTSSSNLLDSLKYIAYFLAKQSILLTTFSLQYSNELIAHFCVQFAIKILNFKSKSPMIRLSKCRQIEPTTTAELIREFSTIFIKYADIYNKIFHDKKEYDLYTDIREVALRHTESLVDRSVSRALNSTTASQSSDTISIERLSLQMSSSTAVPSPSYHLQASPQSNSNTIETAGLKRALDCSNDDDIIPMKRPTIVLKSK